MRLLSLDIRNFRVIKRAVLPLPDSIIGVIGPNGAGKSSLVEAISWALYGNQAARSGRDEIKSQFAGIDENCEVKLGFEVNGESYRVVRRLVGRTERAEVQLYRGAASESVGINETRQYVGQLLGLDFRGFLTSFLARQQELNALSDLQPSKRRDHLAGMLGIERLDKGISRLKEELRFEASKIDFMERHLAQGGELAERIAQLTARLGELSAGETVLADTLCAAEAAARQAVDRFAAEQTRKSEWAQLTAKLEAERESQKYLQQQGDRLQTEIGELAQMSAEMSRLDEVVKPLPELRAEFERLQEARSRRDLRRQWLEQVEANEKVIQELAAALIDGRRRLRAFKDKLGSIPADVAKLLENAQRDLEQARAQFSDLKAERDSLARSIEKLQAQIQSVEQFGPASVCDRCHRPLGEDLPRIKQHLMEELAALKQTATELDRRLSHQRESGQEIKMQWAELDGKAKERYQAEIEKTAVNSELAKIEVREREVTASLAKLSRQLSDTAATAFDPAEFDRLKQRRDELEAAQSRRRLLEGKLSRLPAATKESEALATRQAGVGNAISKFESQRSELHYDPATFARAQTELEAAQQGLEQTRREQASFARELEITRTELNEKLKQRDALQKEEAELEEHRTSRYHHEKLGSLLAEFRQDLIARIRPRLADLSSRLFADMTGGKYSFVELDPKYNLRVMDGGEFFGVERFSGGEKDLANLCLRLAISQALTESAGLDRSFVILDEVFGSQDNERKELIIDALGGLKHQFPQILLITHVEDIKDRIEDLIQVRPTGNGYSEVIFNDVVVA